MKKKGLSFGSVVTILLTCVVLAGCAAVYSAFHSDADVEMQAIKMAGLLSDAFMGTTDAPMTENVTVTTVTLAPQSVPTASVATPAPTPMQQSREISLTFAGLASFDSNISDSVYSSRNAVCDFQPVLSAISPYLNSDVCLAAVGQTFNASGKNYSDTAVHPSAALALRSAGFDLVAASPDDVLKSGAEAARSTADALYQSGLICSGFNAGNANQLQWIQKGDVKIALIVYEEKLSTKAANTLQTASGSGMLTVDTMDELHTLVDTVRREGANGVIVYCFWHNRDAQQVTDDMRKTALEITAAGADIIIGTGTKRLLPAAWLSTSDEEGMSRRALVMYSLGSLLSESREAYDIAGALAHVKMRLQGNDLSVYGVSYTPTYIWKQNLSGAEQYRVICSSGEAPAQMNESQRGVMSRSLQRTNESLQETLRLINEE